MLFNSPEFAIFFLIIFFAYWSLRKRLTPQNHLLLVASYVFYGWWDVRFLFLIVLTTVIDYCAALLIDRGALTVRQRVSASTFLIVCALLFVVPQWQALWLTREGLAYSLHVDWSMLFDNPFGWKVLGATLTAIALGNAVYPFVRNLSEGALRKLIVTASIVANLTILGFFKYFNFFADSFAELYVRILGVQPDWVTLNIVLPVGISFYTFQTMSYTIDVYRRDMKATDRLSEFATYLAFFPQLVAGPIERGAHLLPQFQRPRHWPSREQIREGVWLIFWGLFKKLVIADNMATIVNRSFEPFDSLSSTVAPTDGLTLLVALYAFALQIYCDFSGYSDIARGTGKLLGFDIMVNFRLPYFATSPSSFWRRWHISLSTWLRDYLYIPLGGNRGSPWMTYRNLTLTMVLGGLWHGAAWNFALWGLYHGLLLSVYRALNLRTERGAYRWWTLGAMGLLMFHFTCIGWLLFRAQNVETIGIFLESIILHPVASGQTFSDLKDILFYGWFLLLFQVIQERTNDLNPMRRWHWFWRLNVWLYILMSLWTLSSAGGQEFIYFAF